MSFPNPVSSEHRRLVVRLPRPLWIGLAAVVLLGAGLAVRLGVQMHRYRATVRKFREMEAIGAYYGAPRWLRSWISDGWLEEFDNQFDEVIEINLFGAEPSDDALAGLTVLPKLQLLTLSGTGITDTQARYFRALPELTVLDLQETQVSDSTLRSIARSQKLQDLNLAGTKITDAGLEYFARLPMLERLILDETEVTDIGMKHLARLTALTELSLNNTRVTDAGLACIAGLSKLERLSLINTVVSDHSLPYLTKFPELTRLSLDGTRVTSPGLAQLQATTKLTYLSPLQFKVLETLPGPFSKVPTSASPGGLEPARDPFHVLDSHPDDDD